MTGLDLAENIRKIRSLKGFSQEVIAESIGVSQKTYSRIENNEVSPTFEQILKIMEVLEVSLNTVFSFDEKQIFNNNIDNSEDFKIFNNTEIEFVVNLYERLLAEKDLRIKQLEAN